MQASLAERIDPLLMEQENAGYWAVRNGVLLDSRPIDLKLHKYQIDWFSENAQVQVLRKAAQMGGTSVHALKTLHGMIYGRYPQGVLYLLPTKADVTDFSKGRFTPLIEENPDTIGAYISDTDAANIKRVGKAHLYFRGARKTQVIEGHKKTSSALKNIPVDRIVFDELDEMDPDMVELAESRLGHSLIKERIFISTPTIPDYGIDRVWQDSDQRHWHIKCERCGSWTCLELTFPDCLHETGYKKADRLCSKCRRPLEDVGNGEWVAAHPNREIAGWWISQLCSYFVEPGEILHAYLNPPNGKIGEVLNSRLGMPYIDARNRLSKEVIYSRCCRDAMAMSHEGPCFAGVDVGEPLWVVIGLRYNDSVLKILWIGRVEDFNELHDLVHRFHVRSIVFDRFPETHRVREWIADHPDIDGWACQYSEHMDALQAWDSIERTIKVGRTDICDQTHDLFENEGEIILPRRTEMIDVFAEHMINLAKVLEEKPDGTVKYVYRRLGDDHFYHAMNYALLASSRVGVAGSRAHRRKSRRKPNWRVA